MLKYFFCPSVHVTDKISGNHGNHSSCSNVSWDLARTLQRTKQQWYPRQLRVSRNYSVGSSWPESFPVDKSFRNMSARTLSVRGTVHHLRPSTSLEIFIFGDSSNTSRSQLEFQMKRHFNYAYLIPVKTFTTTLGASQFCDRLLSGVSMHALIQAEGALSICYKL